MDPITLTTLSILLTGLFLIGSELILGVDSGFDLLLIGSSIFIGGLLGLITQSIELAFGVSIVLSLAYLFIGRKYVKSKLNQPVKPTNVDSLLGVSGVTTKKISPDKAGQVKVDQELWRAQAETPIATGEKVVVEAIEGVTLLVRTHIKT